MKKPIVKFCSVVAACVLVVSFSGCGKQGEDFKGQGGGYSPITASNLFNVSGAKAILTASTATSTSSNVHKSAIKSMSSGSITELLKLSSSGSVESIITSLLEKRNHPPIAVIENAPDGSIYIGFQWGVWISDGASNESTGRQVAFFRIKTDGSTEIVDSAVYGIGSWYGGGENGELPVKQVQFVGDASSYDVYYIGKNSTGNSILKKKAANGTITQIGNDRMSVRDFIICPNGLVFFHGSNEGNWNIEWLRVINASNAVNNVFYNDGQHWLRSYYYYTHNSVNYMVLVGENLTLYDENGKAKKYSGIVRVALAADGTTTAVTALYDDNNMYSDTYSTIGNQLIWGYWDPAAMTNKRFFARDDSNRLIFPLSREAGATEAAIQNFILQQYQTYESQTITSVTFQGLTTIEVGNEDSMARGLNNTITSNVINGKTWAKWREENSLQSVHFANAKQLLFDGSSGKLYAILSLDQWGSGSSKGEKLFQILDASGQVRIVAFPQDTSTDYRSMSKARIYSNYAVYLSNKGGYYKILRLNLNSPTTAPVDMIPSAALSKIEIFNFDYDSAKSMLYYDVYNLNNNTSYVAEQAINSTTMTSQISAPGYTITDVVPFTATN